MTPKNTQTAWERWELAALEDGRPPERPPLYKEPPPTVTLPTAEALERIHQDAAEAGRAEGYLAGHTEGYAVGLKEAEALGRETAAQLLATAAKLDEALAALDDAVAEELTALALEIARQVLRQTVDTQPETIVPVVRDALAQLPLQHAAIHLHPEDAQLLRMHAGEQMSHAGHRILDDARVSRGDVLVEAGGAQVDGTLASRWQRVIGALGLRDRLVPQGRSGETGAPSDEA